VITAVLVVAKRSACGWDGSSGEHPIMLACNGVALTMAAVVNAASAIPSRLSIVADSSR
jgi:hypothetical protein